MSVIRLFVMRLRNRVLGLFYEVRSLRKAESQFGSKIHEISRELFDVKRENERLTAKVDELQHGLTIMTEARLNADRTADVIRAQMETVREVSEREIASMKQTVDWMSLELRGRQVFGTAPVISRAEHEENTPPSGRMSARMASRELTQHFLEEAMRRGQQPPEKGPEYSSTTQFSPEFSVK